MKVGKLITMLLLVGGLTFATAAQDYPRYRAIGSPYVPLDSWVYPAFERLAAMGYLTTSFSGAKPWTRTECARLVDEMSEAIQKGLRADSSPPEDVAEMHEALEREFLPEITALGGGPTRSLRVDSVYARVLSISGPPLTDGFHFGQTVSYDLGRPNRRGTNAIAGASASATAGPFAFYVRGEFQHAPASPALSDPVLDLIAQRDLTPRQTARNFPAINRGRFLDAYGAFNFKNWQLSAGFQSFSWGPGEDGSLLLSNNADPIPMLRLARVMPLKLPSFLKWLGPIRTDTFLGRLEGHQFSSRPFIFGQQFTFKPVRYLEIGLARTIMIGGLRTSPFTWGNFWNAYFSLDNRRGISNPGDERNNVHWVFYIPGLGNRFALYGETMGDESWSLEHPTRAVWRPGLYVARIPGLSRMDFRLEASNSEALGDLERAGLPGRSYWNQEYLDGYTNHGVVMGNTVGRMGRSFLFRTNYWMSPRHTIGFAYRHSTVRPEFVPGGARWDDYKVKHEIHLRSGLYLKSSLQIEHIGRYPILFPGSRNNVGATIELGFLTERSRP